MIMMRGVVFVALLALGIGSCAPVYVPNVRNAPLFTKAGEVQGTVLFGSSDLDLQGAVAITNNVALMGNYSYGNRNTDSVNQNHYHKHEFYEGGIGYYKNDRNFCFEIFVGFGQGKASSYGDYSLISPTNYLLATGRFNRIFFQPSFGFNKKVVNIAFTPRISWVDFAQFSNNSSTRVFDPSPRVFFEPAVTVRFNFLDNRFYGLLQGGLALPVNGDVLFDYEGASFSTGLGIRLGGLHWEPVAGNK